MGPVAVDAAKCKRCNACRRVCPTKATKVAPDGQRVLPDLCIGCGTCVAACSQSARRGTPVAAELEAVLSSGKAVAVLDPTFILAFPRSGPGQVEAGLLALGFKSVLGVGPACRLVVEEYRRLLAERATLAGRDAGQVTQPLVSSSCPAVVALVEKHYPDLIGALAPVVSWPVAAARAARPLNPEARFVYIGPCEARKMEVAEGGFGGDIELVATFGDVSEALARENILLSDLEPPVGDEARTEPDNWAQPVLAGGLSAALGLDHAYIVAAGAQRCTEALEEMVANKTRVALVDAMFCRGCMDAPMLRHRLTFWERKEALLSSWEGRRGEGRRSPASGCAPAASVDAGGAAAGVDLSRTFRDRAARLPVPRDTEVAEILRLCGILGPQQELNCGACGFPTCRARAVAIYRDLEPAEECPGLARAQTPDRFGVGVALYPGRGDPLSGLSSPLAPSFPPRPPSGIEARRERLRAEVTSVGNPFDAIYGRSPQIAWAKTMAARAATANSPVLLMGESGTGKEMFARAIHSASHRRAGPFVAVNCAAIPETLIESDLFGYEAGAFTGAARGGMIGKMEHASGGTLFLDEVGDMRPNLQAKLLRALQDYKIQRVGGVREISVDVRLIAATNKDLKAMVDKQVFRDDLYYRINVIMILIPPLRERRVDIPEIVRWSMLKLTRRCGVEPKSISPGALRVLMDYDWPGNVRELENVLERVLVTTDGAVIEAEHVLSAIPGSPGRSGGAHQRGARDTRGRGGLGAVLADAEREVLQQTLEECGYNKVLTAKKLGISRSTLYQKLARHGLCFEPAATSSGPSV